MLNLSQFQALLLIFLAVNSKSVITNDPDEELLLIIHKNAQLKIYIYFFEDFSESFGSSLLNLKRQVNNIRTFIYRLSNENHKTNSSSSFFSFPSNNFNCQLIQIIVSQMSVYLYKILNYLRR